MPAKVKQPMGTLDRIELAIANAAQTLFPDDRRLSADERARRVHDYEEFRRAARDIMDFVDDAARDAVIGRALEAAKVDGSHRAELRTQRKEQIVNLLLLACLVCTTNANARHENIERLRREITNSRIGRARQGKEADSKLIKDLVQHHARRRWKENPRRRTSERGTAREIHDAVNESLEQAGLRRVGFEAIRKRIREFR
jgi:HEPN domain-containing protein